MKIDENKKSVLVVHNYYQIPGGEDSVVANEIQILKQNGHKVELYSRNNNEIKNMNILQKIFLPIKAIFNVKTYFDIERIIKNDNINIVHVHNTLNLISPSVYYAARRCGVPVVQTIHNFRFLCPGATLYRNGQICEDCVKKSLWCAVKHKCYRSSRSQTLVYVVSTYIHRMTGILGKISYICLTDFNRDKLEELKQIKSNNIYVKPNFVSKIGDFIPENHREDQYIFAGRLDKIKGIDVLLSAWKKMGDEAPKLIVCGTGPLEEWCSEYVMNNNLNVEMKGFVPNEITRALMAESRALILPTQWYEGFPMGIVEAFSVGTPVICSDIGNVGAIVKEGVTGAKFEFNDIDGIISALDRVKGLCEAVKAEYEHNYNQKTNYKQLMDIYNSLV